MNPRRFLVASSFCAFAFSAALASGAPIATDSKITSVTVYGSGAVVTREAQVELPAGSQEVLFANLPNSIDPDLLQVSGDGSAKATILDVTAASAQLVAPANARLKELQDQLRSLQSDLRKITDQATVLQQQRDYLERIKNVTTVPPGKDGGPLPAIEQWQKLVTFYTESIGRVLGEMQDVDRQRDDAQARINVVQAQIDDLKAPAERTVQNVTVRVDVASAGTMTMRLAYTVDDASWSPSYDVRVTSADKSIALGYAALVRQSSGEDWKAVKLVLSTAKPSVGGTAPTLTPWYVDQAAPVPVNMPTTAGAAAPAVRDFRGEMRAEEKEKVKLSPFEVAQASVESGLTSATFTIANPADIPADNAAHKVAITSAPLKGTLNHVAIPKLVEAAYLRAMVTNTSDFPLIGGDVNLFLDGNFVARSKMKTVMPGEKFDLDLGVDDGITVKRKLLNRLTETAGWVSKRSKITYDVLLTVQNNRKTAETVILKDQLPISRNEKILVELVQPPERDIRKDDDGTITWTLDLKPGEKREIPLKISVDYPQDLQIGGLD